MATFRERVLGREALVGTFVKTASHQTVEVLGGTGLDFGVIDAEHAPFGRNALDISLLAARAGGFPALVRVPDARPQTILDVLDMGATGVLVPHVCSAADVETATAAARYRGGLRGFSNSPRAGGYGQVGMQALVDQADREVVTIVQVEDREAVERIDDIVAAGPDCLFIGRADLAVSYGVFDIAHPDIDRACQRIAKACRGAGRPLGVFLGSLAERSRWVDLGASFFVIGSDQSLLRAGAVALAREFRR